MGIFSLFDSNNDGALQDSELDELFSTAPESPWDEAPYKNSVERTEFGDIRLSGFLSQENMVREQQTQTGEGGSSSSINDVDVMTKVLGERRGHNRGRGRKLKGASSSQSSQSSQSYQEQARVVDSQGKEIK